MLLQCPPGVDEARAHRHAVTYLYLDFLAEKAMDIRVFHIDDAEATTP